MFGLKKSGKDSNKLMAPGAIPNSVQMRLVSDYKMDANLAQLLKAVLRTGADSATDIRVFDESDAMARQVAVKDYTSLDGHPEVVLYEGSFNDASNQVTLVEKKRPSMETTIFTQAEIQQKIEKLTEPGSTVFFYHARGGAHGGPLGMGAAVIELNPDFPGSKQKKYIIYQADVVDMEPVGKGRKIFEGDKLKDVAVWVKDCHQKRQYSS